MIKFFRRIRQRLIIDNKIGRYLVYAIGEIFLVVIGILIALQINNWNENQKTLTIEQGYLRSLQSEFTINTKKLNQLMERNDRNAKNALTILAHTGKTDHDLTEETFAKLFFGAFNREVQYRPSSGVLDEIINSGNLEIISNEELKILLSSWGGALYQAQFQEKEHGHYRETIIGICQAESNLRQVFVESFGEVMGITASKFDEGFLHLLQSMEFDNNLTAFAVTAQHLNNNYYTHLASEAKQILRLIGEEIKP